MKKKYLPIDYVNIKKDIPFTLDPFNEVDAVGYIIFLLMDINNLGIPKVGEEGYITYEQAVQKQHELHGNKKFGLLLPTSLNDLIDACALSNRFKNSKFYNLINKVNDVTQSTIVMCDITDDITLVIFGGTDDSVVGWVEDFDLMVSHNVLCLYNAKKYVNKLCRDPNKKYIFAGHSKGGMCTAYAFFTADDEVRDRVIAAYDMDGPGFDTDTIIDCVGCTQEEKLKLICPVDSFVGRLFFQPVKPIICPSIDKGINQHNPTGWVIDGNKFATVKKYGSTGTIKALMAFDFMNSLTHKQKENAVQGLTKIAKAGYGKSLSTIVLKPLKLLFASFKLSKEEKKIMLSAPIRILKSKKKARKKVKKDNKINK